MDAPKLRGTKEEHKRVSATGAKAMAVKATWHVKLTRGDHARTAFTDYLNRVPKRGAIETVHVDGERDRKSTRLNSSHTVISYAVFCLKKKKNQNWLMNLPLLKLDLAQLQRT